MNSFAKCLERIEYLANHCLCLDFILLQPPVNLALDTLKDLLNNFFGISIPSFAIKIFGLLFRQDLRANEIQVILGVP